MSGCGWGLAGARGDYKTDLTQRHSWGIWRCSVPEQCRCAGRWNSIGPLVVEYSIPMRSLKVFWAWAQAIIDPSTPMPFWKALLLRIPLQMVAAIFILLFVIPRRALLPILVSLILYVWLIFGIRRTVHEVHSWIAGGAHNRAIAFIVAVYLCAVCYGYRGVEKHKYGLYEIAFGLTCLWEGLNPTRSSEAAVALLLGGMFVVVRGIDNTHAGWKENRESRDALIENHTLKSAPPQPAVPPASAS